MLSRSRSTSRDCGRHAVSSGRVPGNSGRWRIASSGCPDGFGMATGKEAGVFVIHVAEFDTVVRTKSREPQALPVEEVLRYGQGDPWASGRKCRVSHHVTLQRFHESDPRILAASAAIGPPLIIGFRLQCDAQPLDAYRIAGCIEPHAGNADARVIPRATSRGKR